MGFGNQWERKLSTKGRPREFDMDQALEAMMQVFWEKGYEGTSLSDIMEATGLQKGSIYKAFRDKKEMFCRALQHYLSQNQAANRQVVEAASSPLGSLEDLLRTVVFELCGSRNDFRGCLAVNSMKDLTSHDEDITDVLKATISSNEKGLSDILAAGQKLGEVRDDIPANHLAEAFYCFTAGLLSTSPMSRTKAKKDRLVSFAINMVRPQKQS